MQIMKDIVKAYLCSRHFTFIAVMALFLFSTLFFATNLQGNDNENSKNKKSSTKIKQQQTAKSSQNIQEADSGIKMGVVQQVPVTGFPDYTDLAPFTEMRLMQEQMESLFDSTFSRFRKSPGFILKNNQYPFVPKMDISENPQNYIIKIDLPGMNKSDIKITFKGNNLIISGTRTKTDKNTKDAKVIMYERSYGHFTRVLSLPGPFDKNKVEARYAKGVLTVNIAKTPPQKEKEVTIKVE